MNKTAKKKKSKNCQSGHWLCSLVTEMLRFWHISKNSKITYIQVIATQLRLPSHVHKTLQSTEPTPEPTLEYWYHFTRWENKGSEKKGDLPKVTQWVSSTNAHWSSNAGISRSYQLRGEDSLHLLPAPDLGTDTLLGQEDRRVLPHQVAPLATSQRGRPLGRGRSRFYELWSIIYFI